MENIGRAREGDTPVSLPRAPRSFSRHDIFHAPSTQARKRAESARDGAGPTGKNATHVIGTPGEGKRETGAKQNKF